MKREVKRQTGFTLVEVLTALVVLTIALGAMVQAAAGHAKTAAYMRDRTLAHWVAMNVAASQRIQSQWPTEGIVEGKDTMAGRDWFWRLTVSATAESSMRRMDIEVRSEDMKNGQELARLEAYLPQP